MVFADSTGKIPGDRASGEEDELNFAGWKHGSVIDEIGKIS